MRFAPGFLALAASLPTSPLRAQEVPLPEAFLPPTIPWDGASRGLVVDPEDGKLLYRYPFRSRTYESVIGANPVVGDDSVYITWADDAGGAWLAWGDLDGTPGFTISEMIWPGRIRPFQ